MFNRVTKSNFYTIAIFFFVVVTRTYICIFRRIVHQTLWFIAKVKFDFYAVRNEGDKRVPFENLGWKDGTKWSPGWYTSVKMRSVCFTGGFKQIKVLFVSNRLKFGNPDTFQLPWLTITWPVRRVLLELEKALPWMEQLCPEKYLRILF